MKILIIGSKGFIGTHAGHYFASKGWETYGADVAVDYANSNYFLIDSSNSDFTEVFNAQSFDVCLNCSGAASVPDSLVHTVRDFTLNTATVLKLVESIRKYQPDCKFINLSSAAVYGNPTALPIQEDAALAPVSPYGFHKKMAEEIIQEYYQLFGINGCSLRVFSAYGPGLYKQLLWDLYRKTATEKQIMLSGSGNETRDFIHINDILQCIDLVIHKGDFKAGVYNVANGEQIAIKKIATLIAKEMNFKGTLKFSGIERIGDPLYWVASIEKIKQLGYTPSIGIEQGVSNYIQWAKESAS